MRQSCQVTTKYTFNAVDSCGNSVSVDSNFILADTTSPRLVRPATDVVVEDDGQNNIEEFAYWLGNHAGSKVDDISATKWRHLPYDFVPEPATALSVCTNRQATVTFKVSDGCSKSVNTQATFVIRDTTPPAFQIAAQDTHVECDGMGNGKDLHTWLMNQGNAVVTDVGTKHAITWQHSSVHFTRSDPTSSCSDKHATVTFKAIDSCGNYQTSTATFYITDTVPPTIIPPANGFSTVVESGFTPNHAEFANWLATKSGLTASTPHIVASFPALKMAPNLDLTLCFAPSTNRCCCVRVCEGWNTSRT